MILRIASMIRIFTPLFSNNSSWIRIQASLFRQIVLLIMYKRRGKEKHIHLPANVFIPSKQFRILFYNIKNNRLPNIQLLTFET